MIPPGVITIQIITPPSNGTVSMIGNNPQYTPNEDFVGYDSYTYQLSVDGTPIGTRNVCITIFDI
jgi:hypothetical protein